MALTITSPEELSEEHIVELYETFHARQRNYEGIRAKRTFWEIIKRYINVDIKHEKVTKSFNFIDKKVIITLVKTGDSVRVGEFRVKKRTLTSAEKKDALLCEKAKKDIGKHQDMKNLFSAKESIDIDDLTIKETQKENKIMWAVFKKYFPKKFSKETSTKQFHYKDKTLKVTLVEDKTKNPPNNRFMQRMEWKERKTSLSNLDYEEYLDTFDPDALQNYGEEMQKMVDAYNTWIETMEKRKTMQTRFRELVEPFNNIKIHEKTVYVFFQKEYIYILTTKPLKDRDTGISFGITRNRRKTYN